MELATLSGKGRIQPDIGVESFLREVESRFIVLPITAQACARVVSPLVRNLFCGAWNCEDLVADSIVNELGERMQAKLEHDSCPVRLGRPDGNS
jgi:hypothetical protein